ncbi:acyl-CoA carboxylase subunit epsilon [Streptomyces sp. NPDC005840]|uniref:Acyl-CoA carboxylase subunit epsilon n=1 Tax=Streptomyces doudnae TaxID=3075536 RepID=A0ABD5ELS5_9ACTN|nr:MULTISPECIES: acyl-CoA carboxylase subunit epsilon [unclassified Streptomyces]MDT0434347.1 acyl-CoA carboxylase subunit epsilon [Streptomyces sp. DSM 41981]MYQ63367.1 acyl-CoA carboxylase subunit epsilon [Streptomyces sp. SID4950]SCD56893.1 Acyl-CoA carboxylase epsilon subunit [Streptomyces sp. SolWspMP-5a-2]
MNIKVVRGNPTPEELAAAVAVVRARAAASLPAAPAAPRDSWSDPARIASRGLPRPGPTSWARTYWPG